MTLLGYRNPARRIVGAVRGLVRRPRGSAKGRPVAVVGHRGAAREAAENTLDGILTDDARPLRRIVSERNPPA